MKVQMIFGKSYSDVMAAVGRVIAQNRDVLVSVEALDGFSCASLATGTDISSDGDDGITFLARINLGVAP